MLQPFISEISVFYSPLGHLDISPLDFQSQLTYRFNSPVEVPRIGDPPVGLQALTPQGETPHLREPSWLSVTTWRVGILLRPCLYFSYLYIFFLLWGSCSVRVKVHFRGICFIYSYVFGVFLEVNEFWNPLHCHIELFSPNKYLSDMFSSFNKSTYSSSLLKTLKIHENITFT